MEGKGKDDSKAPIEYDPNVAPRELPRIQGESDRDHTLREYRQDKRFHVTGDIQQQTLQQVSCNTCRYIIRNKINPHSGACKCELNQPGVRYPMQEHVCKKFCPVL